MCYSLASYPHITDRRGETTRKKGKCEGTRGPKLSEDANRVRRSNIICCIKI